MVAGLKILDFGGYAVPLPDTKYVGGETEVSFAEVEKTVEKIHCVIDVCP